MNKEPAGKRALKNQDIFMRDTEFLVEKQALSPEHLRMLRDESGISDEVIAARGYRTVTDPTELAALNFAPNQRRVPGLLLPVHCADGSNLLFVYRPDNPRETWNGKGKDYKHKTVKYELPKGQSVRLDCPPTCRPYLADPQIPLWITEGQKKADALASRNQCAIALLGVWNFKGRNSFGGITFLADWDCIALNGREVRIVFDSDVMTKPQVRQALDRLKENLDRKNARVGVVYLPKHDDGKNGVDDYLAAGHTIDDLLALVEAPHPLPQPALPTVELLDSSPPTMGRPLSLIDAHSYAGIWPYVKITRTQELSKQGDIMVHDPPIVTKEPRRFILRDDGKIFGSGGGCESMENLGVDVHLPEMPPNDKLWSTIGVKAYVAGKRPDACDVFTKVGAVVDKFIDFDHSLANQTTMVEMVSCYILSTWFLDAFDVIGFLWPNGDRGCGKTQMLIVVTELSYLGIIVLAGGSFASLRDLADYGATIAFDDAENLADPRFTDPDKRALLLAGNRRGNVVPLKEIRPDKTWRTRYVNTFCPRLFSAIRLPDSVLASRTIVVPLVRTPDRARSNSQPLDYRTWPFDRRGLIDDLWALALSNLRELRGYEALVNERAELTGRNLEPWRPLLAVALWLQDQGVDGLWDRMQKLSMNYQTERSDLEVSDLTILIIRGLFQCAIDANSAISDINRVIPREWFLKTSAITRSTVQVAKDLEMDVDISRITERRVGRVLGSMRFEKSREGGRGDRGWLVKWNDLHRLAITYALTMPASLSSNVTNGENGDNGT